jgi:uncharacterized LabA/DUF88 family protein
MLDKSFLTDSASHENDLSKFSSFYKLLDLLPSRSQLVNQISKLNEIIVICHISIEAINSLINGDLKKFDSFVGENACEIRAVWIAIIASKNSRSHFKTYERLVDAKEILRNLLYHNETLTTEQITSHEHQIQEILNIIVDFELYFAIQAFLLSEAKIILAKRDFYPSLCVPAKSDPKRLKRFGNVSSTFLEKLVRKSRKFVAAASVQFVQKQANRSNDENLMDMVSSKFTINHNNHLLCTPMFWTYKCALLALIQNKIPLVINARFLIRESTGYRVIDEDWLFFETPALGTKDLVRRNVGHDDLKKAALIIQGAVLLSTNKSIDKHQWRQTLLRYPIATTILAGAADHSQYPASKHNDLIDQTQDYQDYKRFAKKAGFSIDNPTTFFIQHVYCSQVNRIFNNKFENDRGSEDLAVLPQSASQLDVSLVSLTL